MLFAMHFSVPGVVVISSVAVHVVAGQGQGQGQGIADAAGTGTEVDHWGGHTNPGMAAMTCTDNQTAFGRYLVMSGHASLATDFTCAQFQAEFIPSGVCPAVMDTACPSTCMFGTMFSCVDTCITHLCYSVLKVWGCGVGELRPHS